MRSVVVYDNALSKKSSEYVVLVFSITSRSVQYVQCMNASHIILHSQFLWPFCVQIFSSALRSRTSIILALITKTTHVISQHTTHEISVLSRWYHWILLYIIYALIDRNLIKADYIPIKAEEKVWFLIRTADDTDNRCCKKYNIWSGH